MKESIRIRDFIVIKKADIEVKKINVLIGPQANGKSIIAKLLYFFKSISNEFVNGIQAQKTKRELDKQLLLKFEEYFPRYTWEGSAFTINYRIDDTEVSINGTKGSKGKTKINLKYSEELVRFFNNKKKLYKKKIETLRKVDPTKTPDINSIVENKELAFSLIEKESFFTYSNSFFIPASRSFFANLQKNIFTFLESGLNIDPFLKEFGKLYEISKKLYGNRTFLEEHEKIFHQLHKAFQSIIVGDYEHYDEQDWIVSQGNKINLMNASSGQQESLPMLLVLCAVPLIFYNKKHMFFIEEPEAHLFPTSQGYIVSILSELYRSLETPFFITSHSPYILSALNNFILAGDTEKAGKITASEFKKMNGSGMPIQFEDVSAYTIHNGKTNSIADKEYRMIGADMLDGVSEHFESVMNQLLVCGE